MPDNSAEFSEASPVVDYKATSPADPRPHGNPWGIVALTMSLIQFPWIFIAGSMFITGRFRAHDEPFGLGQLVNVVFILWPMLTGCVACGWSIRRRGLGERNASGTSALLFLLLEVGWVAWSILSHP